MAIELVTGHAGEGHVSSADVGRYNAGVCGSGKYVLNTGQRFAYTIDSNNLVKIASGDAVDQGRHIIIPQNTSEDAVIENGTQGRTRIDVIALRYTKDTSGQYAVESASLIVVKGTEVPTGSTPVAPVVTSGDIFDGAVTDDMPLYHVLITDTVITSVTKVFTEIKPLAELSDELISKVYPVGSIYMSVTNTNPGALFSGTTWQQIQGKFLLGASSGHAAGSTGGAETVTLTAAHLPAHTHTIPDHTHDVPDHVHTVPAHGHTATCADAGNHRHAIRRLAGAGAGDTRFAIQGSDDNVTFNSNYAGTHKHVVTVSDAPAASTVSSGACTTGSGGAGSTGSVGSGSAVGIMPPYLTVYMWQRTA